MTRRETLPDVLAAAAAGGTGGVRFTDGVPATWAEVAASAAAAGRALTGAGLEAGDRIVLLLPNGARFVDLFLGAIGAGIVPVPVNVDYRGEMLRRTLDELSPVLVVTDGGDERAELAGHPVATADAVVAGDTGGAVGAAPDPLGPAFMMLTSGTTTGRSKVVVYSHAAALQFTDAAVRNAGYRASDVVYTCLPLVHGAALMCEFLGAMRVGAEIVVAPRFSVSRYWDDISDHRVTATNTLGSMTTLLCRAPAHPRERDHVLRLVRRSGAGPELTREFESRFGVVTTEMYGLNDAGLIIGLPPGEHRVGTCGRVLPEWEARLVGPDGAEVAEGVAGELLARPVPPAVLPLGYLGADPPYGDAVREGWFVTGDLLARDADGYLTFVGRAKDVIRRGGENVAPADVEEALLDHPDVAEAAVFAVPSELGEDEVMAAVVPAGPGLDVTGLRAHCENRLPHFAVPRFVRLLPELPRTPTQKVRIAALRGAGITEDTVDTGSTSRTALAGKERTP